MSDPIPGNHIVFVYGTLKRGHPNHSPFMDGARFIGKARTRERFELVIGGRYFTPYLIDQPGSGHHVAGELYAVDDTMLVDLDLLESTHLPDGYRRVRLTIVADGGDDPAEAWTYVRNRAHISGIHEGPLDSYPLDPRYVLTKDRPPSHV